MFPQICCGGNHSLALTTDEEVFIWGDGRKGRLGNDLELNIYLPSVLDVEGMKKQVEELDNQADKTEEGDSSAIQEEKKTETQIEKIDDAVEEVSSKQAVKVKRTDLYFKLKRPNFNRSKL